MEESRREPSVEMANHKPTIAFFAHYAGLYGANLSLLTLVEGVVQRGWDCMVVVPHGGALCDKLKAHQVPVVITPFDLDCHALGAGEYWGIRSKRAYTPKWFASASRMAMRNARRSGDIATLLANRGVDLIHTNSSWVSIGASVAKMLHVPHIWHLREFGVADYCCYPDFGVWRQRRRIRKAGTSVCISAAVRRHFFPQGCDPKKVKLIYNGVESARVLDERLASYREDDLARRRVFTVASIGVLHKGKGHDIVIDAFSVLKASGVDARLVIAGDGPCEQELRQRVLNAGLAADVDFSGHVTDMAKIYGDVDAVAVASRSEAMGRVAAESMANGVPVIGRDAGATPELVEHGVTGFIFDGTPADLARKIRLLIGNENLRKRMGRAALQAARLRFTKEAYTDSVCSVFAESLFACTEKKV